MSTTQNSPVNPKQPILRANIDVSSGPRSASDPRLTRSTQQMMASRMAGYGLQYDDEGRLAIDTERLELLALAQDNVIDSLVQGIEVLGQKGYLGRMLAWDFELRTTNNTGSQFTFATLEIPRSILIGTHAVRMVAWGDCMNNTAGTTGLDFEVDLGATQIFLEQSATTIVPTSPTRRLLYIDVTVQATNSNAAQMMYGSLTIGHGNAATTGIGNFTVANEITTWYIGNLGSTANCTNAIDLAFKITMTGAAVPSAQYEFKHYGSHLIVY